MFKKVFSALRRAAWVVLNNLWLFWFGLGYSLAGFLLILGGTAVPIFIWVASGKSLDARLLYENPFSFMMSYPGLVLYSMAGCLVGFTVYLFLFIFFRVAYTSVAVEALAAPGRPARIESSVFWSRGRRHFGASSSAVSMASLVPLPPLLVLLLAAGIILVLMGKGALQGGYHGVALALLGLAALIALVFTILFTGIALLWYAYGLCAVCRDRLGGTAGMKEALRFFKKQWAGVLLLFLVSLLIIFLGVLLTLPLDIAAKIMKFLHLGGSYAVHALSSLISVLISVILSLWLGGAVVAFYMDNHPSPATVGQDPVQTVPGDSALPESS